MSNIEIKRVVTKKEMRDFISLPRFLYKDCPQFVPDLDLDVRNMFSQGKNAGLSFCDIQPFLAYKDGKPVGRIMGIINKKANDKWKTQTVRFSLIEFIDDEEVARALLSAVEQWGISCGMSVAEGPMGITDFDKEGMLVEDFQLTGSMTAIYNPDYYPEHLENLGYAKAVDWLQVRVRIPEEVPAKYARVAKLARESFNLHIHTMTKEELNGDYVVRVFDLLNECYSQLFGFSEFSREQMFNFVKKYSIALDPKLIPVVENADGEIVGVAVTMVSLVEALQKSQGRMMPFGWWHFMKNLWWKPANYAEMLLVAVRKDYQGMGVNALFFDYLIPVYNQYGIEWAETGPQLEDNVRVLSQWKPLNPEIVKRRRCYSKQLA